MTEKLVNESNPYPRYLHLNYVASIMQVVVGILAYLFSWAAHESFFEAFALWVIVFGIVTWFFQEIVVYE